MNNKSVAISKDAQNGMYSVYIFTEGVSTAQKYPLTVVRDIEILEDMLYFCGSSNGKGVIGKMSLTNVGASTEITVLPLLQIVSKIKLRNISGVTHVFGIGIGINLLASFGNNCIFEIFTAGTNLICLSYSCIPNEDVELFTDIDLTNHYIAVVGYHKDPKRMKVWKRDLLTPQFTSKQSYINTINIDSIESKQFYINYLYGDEVAIVSVAKTATSSSFGFVNLIDMNSFSTTANFTFPSNYYPVRAIDYIKDSNRLFILQIHPQYPINNIFYLNLSPSVYTIPISVINNAFLNNLSTYKSSFYTAVGANTANKLFLFNKDFSDFTQSCNAFASTKKNNISPAFNFHNDLNYTVSSLSIQSFTITTSTVPINVICN